MATIAFSCGCTPNFGSRLPPVMSEKRDSFVNASTIYPQTQRISSPGRSPCYQLAHFSSRTVNLNGTTCQSLYFIKPTLHQNLRLLVLECLEDAYNGAHLSSFGFSGGLSYSVSRNSLRRQIPLMICLGLSYTGRVSTQRRERYVLQASFDVKPKGSHKSGKNGFAQSLSEMLPLIVASTAAAALINPATFAWVSKEYYAPALGGIMLSIGVQLSVKDFTLAFQRPLPLTIGYMAQYLLKPILGLLIARAFEAPPIFASGFILMSCVSGAQLSSYASYLSNGDVALSIVLTSFTTISSVIVTPLLTGLLIGSVVPVDAVAMSRSILQNTIGMEAIEKSREAIHGDQQGSEPELTKLEQLLKNKTFSRDEFNRLTELMQSRIVDSSSGLNDYEEKMREELHGRDGPNNAAANSEAQRWREERKKAREEKEICLLDNGLFGNASSPAVPPNISDDVGSSPADIAKAYMGVRPFRASPSTLALQGRTIRDEGAPSRLNSLPIVPRTEGWPVGNGQLEDRYKTPQSARVRSRIHGIARTPYTRNIPHQTSVQMLKRRSSVLDDGFASVGPIRRTRMKSTFTTPSTKPDPSAPNDNQLIPLLSPRYDSSRNALSIKRTSEMERQIDVFPTFPARDNVTKSMGVGLAFVPPQSSETARKILEHLDRMVPSPKEKSAEAQLAIARDKSPSQLTVSMLNGHARRSTEIIDVAPFLDMHGTSSSAVQTYNQSLVDGVSGGDQKYIGKGKAPLFNSMAMPKEMPTSSGAGNATSQAPDTVCARLEANSAVPDSTLIVPEKSRGFRMSALEVWCLVCLCLLLLFEALKIINHISNFFSLFDCVSAGSSSSLSSSSNFSTSTAVTTSSTAAPLFGVLASKTGGMNVPLFSSPGLSSSPSMTVMNNTNLAAPSSITQSEPSSVAGTGHPFKSLTNGDQNTSKFPNQTASGSSSPSSSLFGVTNVTSSMSSSATQTSNSANSLLPNSQLYSAASMPVQASGSAPAAISAPFGIGNSASLPSILSSTSSTSLLSSSSSLSFGSTGSLFGATPASSLSSSSLGSFGLSAPIPFSSASAPSFGLSSSTFGTSTPAQCGSGIPQTPGSGSTSMFGSTTSPSLVSSGISSFGGSSVPSFGLSSTPQLGSGTSSSFGLSTTQFGSSASPSFGLSTTPQFGSSSSPSFGMSSTQFGSSTSPSFGSGVNFGLSATSSFASASTPSFGSGSTPSFGSGSTPSFSSGSIFGSGSSPLFGGSSVSFGSSSTPSFVSGSTPSFGLTPSFGASTATSSTQSPTPSFGSGFGATPSSAATAFSFGGSAAASSGSFQFAASGNTTAGSTFLFNSSTGASPSTFTFSSKDSSPVPQQSMFGLANSPPTFGAAPSTTSNDQMNMEDSMAEDPAQLSSPTPSVFGQSASPASAPFLFSSQTSSAAAGQSVFQFGAQSTPVASNPFAAGAQSTLPPAGGLEFPAGGFSLGAGGEKSGRRIIKAKRDKGRRK